MNLFSYYPPINVIRKRGRARHVAAVYKMQQRQAEKAAIGDRSNTLDPQVTYAMTGHEEGPSVTEQRSWQAWLDRLTTLDTIPEDEQATGEPSTSSRSEIPGEFQGAITGKVAVCV